MSFVSVDLKLRGPFLQKCSKLKRNGNVNVNGFHSFHQRPFGKHRLSEKVISCSLSEVETTEFPEFIPQEVTELSDLAQSLAKRLKRISVQTDLGGESIPTSCLIPRNAGESKTPVLLIHSFDSSCLEWRKFYPILEEIGVEAWALDVLGWGFTDTSNITTLCSAEAKRKHIFEFWRQYIRRPVVVLGTSLGGAAAIDLALNHPEVVSKLVLVDAQGFSEGLGPMASLPKFLSYAGVYVLQSMPLRRSANNLAYFNQELATEEAVLVGRLHTLVPGWSDSMVTFMQSGGYNLADKVKNIKQETLVVWGADDKILKFDFAKRFMGELPNARLEVLKECGHVPHLEKPRELSNLLKQFIEA